MPQVAPILRYVALMNKEENKDKAAAEEPEPEPDDASSFTAASKTKAAAAAIKTKSGKGKDDGSHRCANCDKPGAKKKCGRCGVEWYCDRNCQRVSRGGAGRVT